MTSTALLLAGSMLMQGPASPLIQSELFTSEAQWAAIEASPRVEVHVADGGKGSSVLIGLKDQHVYALTANHVLRNNARITIDLFERNSYPASERTLHGVKVVGQSATADIALLKIPIPADAKPPPVLRLIAPGQRPNRFPFDALSVGCNDGFSARCQADTLIARAFIRRPEGNAFFWKSFQMSRSGRSGGPLIDSQNRVIGICVANQGGYGYFAHSDEIHAWLKQLEYDWLWR